MEKMNLTIETTRAWFLGDIQDAWRKSDASSFDSSSFFSTANTASNKIVRVICC